MAATLTSILLHITFSTKHRERMIPLDLRPDLYRFIGGVCRDMHSPLLHAGGVEDHVHLLVSLSKTVTVSDLLLNVKRPSSTWAKNQRPGMHGFGWQDGYFAFSVGHDGIGAVRSYFDTQEEHHKAVGFQDEILAFLKKYHVEYDPRFLWD